MIVFDHGSRPRNSMSLESQRSTYIGQKLIPHYNFTSASLAGGHQDKPGGYSHTTQLKNERNDLLDNTEGRLRYADMKQSSENRKGVQTLEDLEDGFGKNLRGRKGSH